MKKIVLSLAILLLSVGYTNAQSFYLTYADTTFVTGDTIYSLPVSDTASDIVVSPIFHNNTNIGVNIEVVRNIVELLDGTENYFCWDTCYDSSVDSSIFTKYIPAGSTSVEGDFAAHYEMFGVAGISIIEYKFYNKDNAEDFVSVYFKFENTPAGIDENLLSKYWLSEIYPNPAKSFVNLDYEISADVELAEVSIVNLFGARVTENVLDVTSNNIRIDVSGLKPGIYFYTLMIKGDIYTTKKLIIH